jgi:anti-anti-sigma factor
MPVTPFPVRAVRDGDTTVLTIVGELDIATVPELQQVAHAELDSEACRTLVLDLTELSFVDSTGVGSWVEIRARAIEAGKRVVVREVPSFARRVLEIGGLSRLFDDVAAAD